MKPFPLRTLLLMVLALAAFGRLWCVTHPPRAGTSAPVPVELVAPPDAGRP